MSLSDFTLLSKVGEGAYSSVHKAKRSSDGLIYALKKVLIMPFRSVSATSTTRKSRTRSMRSVSWPPSTRTSSSNIRRPSSTPKAIHCASSWNSQRGETSRYSSCYQESNREEETYDVVGRGEGDLDYDGSGP